MYTDCLITELLVCLLIDLSRYPAVCLPVCPPSSLSVYLPVCLSTCMSVTLSVLLFVCVAGLLQKPVICVPKEHPYLFNTNQGNIILQTLCVSLFLQLVENFAAAKDHPLNLLWVLESRPVFRDYTLEMALRQHVVEAGSCLRQTQ